MVKHEERYRRLWMQPRNKRSIPPYLMQQVLFDFIEALDGEGKLPQNSQKVLSNQLEDHGLKNDFGSRDINPGGIRTYVAQLESLGLIFHDKHQRYKLTLAGEDLLKTGDITSLMQTQLIRYQYPSAYSKAKKVGIHPKIKVRPFSFLLKLCRDVGLDGLSSDEFAIPVVYGHTEKAFNLCKEKILESRSLGGISDLLNAEKDIDLFYSPQRKATYKDRVKSIQNLKDIGATMRAHLLSNRLIFREVGSDRFKVEETALPLIDSVNREKFLKYDNYESFQRKFGRGKKQKDTRNCNQRPSTDSLTIAQRSITYLFHELARSRIIKIIDSKLLKIFTDKGYKPQIVREVIEPMLPYADKEFAESFIKSAKGDANQFEIATTQIFEELGFDARRVGNLHGVDHSRYTDILLVFSDGTVVVIDNKASASTVSLGVNDIRRLEDHSINFQSIEGLENTNAIGCVYVGPKFNSNIGKFCSNAQSKVNLPVGVLTASHLLRILDKFRLGETTTKEIKNSMLEGNNILLS
tara:strand:+ start:310 stop:1878 length:1569 start_codon:yes stop_codon:yes gene_type:complete